MSSYFEKKKGKIIQNIYYLQNNLPYFLTTRSTKTEAQNNGFTHHFLLVQKKNHRRKKSKEK